MAAADNFELGIGDGHHNKKRTAAQACGPFCKIIFLAMIIIVVNAAVSCVYTEARIKHLRKELTEGYEQSLKKLQEAIEKQIAADSVGLLFK